MKIFNLKNFVLLVVIIFSSNFLTGCYYDKANIVYPTIGSVVCDTINVTYATQVVSIVNAQCNSCHGATTASTLGAGIVLSSYTSIKPYITNGSLVNSILQNGKASPMPKNSAKLASCSINQIQAWVRKGAINN